MLGRWGRRVIRHLRRRIGSLQGGRRRAWRAHPSDWTAANVRQFLKSSQSDPEAHLRVVADELARRLTPVLARLDEGPDVLHDRDYASAFQFALTWLAYQGDITRHDAALRAYCDITASLAIFEQLVRGIAGELASGNEEEVASRIANASENWREPLLVAGRRRLAAGDYDAAAGYARRALNIVSACPESQRLLLDALRERQRDGGTLEGVARAGLADLRGRFCPRPFEVLVSGQSTGWRSDTGTTEQVLGASYLCDCAAWLPFIAGNVVEADSPDDVWNSAAAQEIRRSILDGDYSYCSRTMCPVITGDTLPRTEEVTAPRLRRIIENRETVLDDGPRLIALGHDSSCNLACPSCRVELVMADKAQNERLERARDRVILPLLRNRQVGLHLTSWGDPFASRHYRSILEALRHEDYDGVRLFLLTNGLGLTRNVWTTMPHLSGKIVELRVSIDAATKETYENVRRPGRWDVLQENLRAMGELSKAGTFRRNRFSEGAQFVSSDLFLDAASPISFALAFVVQSANFREIPDFVRLGEEVHADAIVFQRYYSFGHEGSAVFTSKDVASASHPEHLELQAVLEDPIMQSPLVLQTFMSQLVDRPSC